MSRTESLTINDTPRSLKRLASKHYDLSYQTCTLENPAKNVDAYAAFLKDQYAYINYYRQYQDLTGPFIRWTGGYVHPRALERLTLINGKTIGNQFESTLKLLNVVNPKITKTLLLHSIPMNQQCIDKLCSMSHKQPFRLIGIRTSGNLTLETINMSLSQNQLHTQALLLENFSRQKPKAPSSRAITSLIEILWDHPHTLEVIDLGDLALSAAQSRSLEELTARNRWMRAVLKDNPHQQLRLCAKESMPLVDGKVAPWFYSAMVKLLETGQFTDIEIPIAKPNDYQLSTWINALRKNNNVTRLVFNESSCSPDELHRFHRQLNINQSINAVFGDSNPVYGRSTLMYGFMGFNFFQSFAAAIAPVYGLAGGIIGGLIVAGLRMLSNYIYHKELVASKQADYWQDANHRNNYEIGQRCAHSFVPWFNYRAWTSAAYLGHQQEKNHVEAATKFEPRPNI